MSQTSASAAGGAIAPGWYTDPNNPSQLRWWSGESWTEHVSPAAPPAPVEAQPVQAQPVQAQPVQAEPAAVPQVQVQSPPQPQQPLQASGDTLPSRRALREPSAEDPAAQQAAQAAQQAQYEAQLAAQAQQQAQQPVLPPVAGVSSQPSPPVPTLPVQPKSFLEQAGYAPLDEAPAGQFPGSAAVAPQVQQQVQAPAVAPQPAQQPGQPLQANAWDQAAQQATEYSNLAATQSGWGQPASPAQAAASAPATAAGVDALFSGQQTANAPTAYAPADTDSRGAAQPQTAGSSTFWGWLIAISPILAAGAVGYVLVSTGYVLSGWPIEAAVAAPYLLVLLFAIADRAALRGLGHEDARSPAWALLSAPVYLIMRASETRREDGSGTALTLMWFFSVLVAVGGFVGYGYLMHHALIPGLPS